jgi:hypothetical protein
MTTTKKLGLASLAAVALLAGAASASADTFYNATTNAPLPSGATIYATNVGNTLLQTSNITYTCQSATAAGAIGTNETPGGSDVGASITALTFSGTGQGSRCTSNSTASPTAAVSTSIAASSPATIAAHAGAPGAFNVSSPMSVYLRLYGSSGAVLATCRYSTSTIAGSVPAGSNQATFRQSLAQDPANPFLCPNFPLTYAGTLALYTSAGWPVRIGNP